jgi:hypothetical protein
MICSQCGKSFTPSRSSQKYCTTKCNQQRHQQSEKYRKTKKKYNESDRGKKAHKNYKQTEKGKKVALKSQNKYLKTEKGKKIYKNYQKIFGKNYQKKRRGSDPVFKLMGNIRNRLNLFLKKKNIKKNNKTFEMVGCTPKFLREYLEKKFEPGMTWKNHSLNGWHVDHQTPLSSAKTVEEFEKLAHYTNLQPMWGTENIKKGNKVI